MTTRLTIRDFVLDMSIGINEEERHKLQPVRITIDLDVTSSVNVSRDDMADNVSYHDIVTGVRALAAARHYNLIETFAERIADHCLLDTRISGVTVRVEKPAIYNGNPVPGVELHRTR